MHLRLITPLALVLAAAPAVAAASAPVGVWSLVDNVELSPNKDQPDHIRIDGLFLIAGGQPDFPQYPGYSEPQPGHMYYACDDADLATCKAEWQDLVAIAGGDDSCRGWGSNEFASNGSVRTQDQASDPDPWPISMGIQPGFSPCEALKMWSPEEPQTGTFTESGTGNPDDTTDGQPSTGGDPETTTTTGNGGSTLDPSTNPTADTASTGGGETAIGEPTSGEATGTGGSTGGATTGALTSTTSPDDDDKSGCACTTTPDGAPADALALLVLLGLVRRRR